MCLMISCFTTKFLYTFSGISLWSEFLNTTCRDFFFSRLTKLQPVSLLKLNFFPNVPQGFNCVIALTSYRALCMLPLHMCFDGVLVLKFFSTDH